MQIKCKRDCTIPNGKRTQFIEAGQVISVQKDQVDYKRNPWLKHFDVPEMPKKEKGAKKQDPGPDGDTKAK
jgi:hypothetical protein